MQQDYIEFPRSETDFMGRKPCTACANTRHDHCEKAGCGCICGGQVKARRKAKRRSKADPRQTTITGPATE